MGFDYYPHILSNGHLQPPELHHTLYIYATGAVSTLLCKP